MKFNLQQFDGMYTAVLGSAVFMSTELTSEEVLELIQLGRDVSDEGAKRIIAIFNPKIGEVIESNAKLEELSNVLLESGHFEERNNAYFRVGNPISIPQMLLEKYREALEAKDMVKFEALDNFWLKCSLNPNVDARENLFKFLDKWGFVITSNGYIVGYRNVDVAQEGNKELHDFIATSYTKIKGQKKAPKNYDVFDDESYVLVKSDTQNHGYNKHVGNLQDLYNNLSSLSETVYTDHHTHTMRIKLGEIVSIPRSKCDESQEECSRGLHVGGTSWLNKDYYGSEGIVVLVNPMDVVSCPNAGIYGKMRTCSYMPIGVAEYDSEGKIIPVATDVYEDDYETYSIEELNKTLQGIDSSTQVIHALNFKEMPNTVYMTIDKYRETLKTKNVYLYNTVLQEFEGYGNEEE